jgi:hypothetical protein
MSDTMEIDTGDEMSTRIVAVGEAVSRAADELKHAVERVTTGMSLLAGLADVHRCRAWVEKREGVTSHRVFLPDAMEGANPHTPGAALQGNDGAEDEPITI